MSRSRLAQRGAAYQSADTADWSPSLDRFHDDYRGQLAVAHKVIAHCEEVAPRRQQTSINWSVERKAGKGTAALRVIQILESDGSATQSLVQFVAEAANLYEANGEAKLAQRMRRDAERGKIAKLVDHLVTGVGKFGAPAFAARAGDGAGRSVIDAATVESLDAADQVVFRVGKAVHERSWSVADRAATADLLAHAVVGADSTAQQVSDALLGYTYSVKRGLEPQVAGADSALAFALSAHHSRSSLNMDVLADVLSSSSFQRVGRHLGVASAPSGATANTVRAHAETIRSGNAAALPNVRRVFGAQVAEQLDALAINEVDGVLQSGRIERSGPNAEHRISFENFKHVERVARLFARHGVDPSKIDADAVCETFSPQSLHLLSMTLRLHGRDFVEERMRGSWEILPHGEAVTPESECIASKHNDEVVERLVGLSRPDASGGRRRPDVGPTSPLDVDPVHPISSPPDAANFSPRCSFPQLVG